MQPSGTQLLYLDYDGVLHHERVFHHHERGIFIQAAPHFVLFEHVELLSALLRPYPRVKIVLSTSWVRAVGTSEAASKLPAELRDRVIGSTFDTYQDEANFWLLPRGEQVYQDYRKRSPSAVLAIDDSEDGWPHVLRQHLVVSDNVLGISEPQVTAQLKKKLEMAFGRASTN